jgi:hypothetical protein
MARLVSVPTGSTGRFIEVDDDGHVWRGETKRDREGAEYVSWRRLPSEFQER